MIGAHAAAIEDRLTVDTNDLDDARWFSRQEVIDAISEHANASFQAPPGWAIARTLLDAWLDGLK